MNDAYRQLPTRLLLQRVAAARRAGDWRAARGEWEACITRAKARVEVVVDIYVARGWIPPDDREDVVQDALGRAGRALVKNLDTLVEGTFFSAMITCAHFQCRDEARKIMRRQRHEASLDETFGIGDDGDEVGRFDRAFGELAEQTWRRGGEIRDADRRVEAAIDRLRDDRTKKLFTLQRLGMKDAMIAEELGVSMANLYQIRSRGLRELRGLIDS